VNWLRAIFIFNGLAQSAMIGFIVVILQAKGFAPALVGLTMSIAALAYTGALPVWGHVGDMITGPRRALQMAVVPASMFAFGFNLPLPVEAIIVCCVVVSASGNPAGALIDAIAMTVVKDAPGKYSRLRLLTSLGMGTGAIVFGFVYNFTGYVLAPFLYLAIMAAIFTCAQFMPLGRDSERGRRVRSSMGGSAYEPPSHGRFGSVGEALVLRPRLVPILFAAMLIYMGLNAQFTYLGMYIVDLGGGAGLVGLAQGIGFAAQVPGMLLAGWLVTRLGAKKVLVGCSVGWAATVLGYTLVGNPLAVLPIRFLVGIWNSGITVGSVMTMARMLPIRLQSTAQTLLQAFCQGISIILAALIGGILYGLAPHYVFAFASACAVAGAALMFVVLPANVGAAKESSVARTTSPVA
jgi:MFS family permease